MKKLMEYKNLLSSDLTDLDKQVNVEISKGWVPFGSIVGFTGTHSNYFVQAVVRYEAEGILRRTVDGREYVIPTEDCEETK